MGKTVGLTFDLKNDRPVKPGDPIDANAELDSLETINLISSAFESGGHRVVRIGNVRKLLDQIENLDVDIVFNICEGVAGRNRESQVPLILEMHDIPFVGADALCLGVTLDKIIAKKCFIADGIPTPRYFNAFATDDFSKLNTIGFPLIVKTRHEGTSKGLTKKSRVEDIDALKRQVELINKKYHQPALVEEFIRGAEFTVPVLGNEKPEAMPVTQVKIDGQMNAGDKIFTFEHVVEKENQIEYLCPAQISNDLTRTLQELAIRAYQSVDCRDFGRVDFRVDENGKPYVLEINPLPSLALKDVFNIFPSAIGSSYEAIMNRILEYAFKRYGMSAAGSSREKQKVS